MSSPDVKPLPGGPNPPYDTTALEGAIDALMNGVRGYAVAADEVADPALGALLRSLGDSRKQVFDDVVRVSASEVRVTPEDDSGTVPGAVHRGWLKAKGAVAGDEAVIAAALTGEEEAVDDLEDALASGMPEPVEEAVRRALLEVQRAKQQLESLTD